jgi:predicted DCC family thiol-disulfide oxidoreductase YuxK
MDESYLLVADGRAYTASCGYIEVCRILGGWWRIFLIAAVIPERMRDWFYAFIARNRYRWFGKADYCALLTQEQRRRLL